MQAGGRGFEPLTLHPPATLPWRLLTKVVNLNRIHALRRESEYDLADTLSDNLIGNDDAKACLEYKRRSSRKLERICNQASKDNECLHNETLDLVDGVSRQRK